MLSWEKLAELARRDDLELFRTAGGVTIYFTIGGRTPAITITGGDLTDEDTDKLLRRLTQRALEMLKELNT